MTDHRGRCLCGALGYAVSADPVRVTICHCRFCQRATGGAYLVEPIFAKAAFRVVAGTPRIYSHLSEGSGKAVHVAFCESCGTKLFMTFARFAEVVGVFGGTFDDPNWYARTPQNSRHVFLGMAQHGTIIPAGVPTFVEHAMTNDGTPTQSTVFEVPQAIGTDA